MEPTWTGTAYKSAHTEDEALKCLATKQGKYDKKIGNIIDKHGSILHILSIKQV